MSDVERIAPPVPTLPPPVGRNVGGNRRRAPQNGERPAADERSPDDSPEPNAPSDHIDEYA
jgi:hypothetical protein